MNKEYTLIGLDIEWNNVILSSEFDKWEVHHFSHNSFRYMIKKMIKNFENKKRVKLNINRRNVFDIKLCKYKALFKNVERTSEVYSAVIKEVNIKKLKKLIENGDMNLNSMLQCIDKKFFFRTMNSTLRFMKRRYKNNTICYCHNLNAELSSILRELRGNDIKNTKKINPFNINPSTSVFRDKNTPLSVTLQELSNITFKCSYALTDKSIKSLGIEFSNEFKRLGYDINFDKLDYKYEKYRSPLKERTAEEKQYNERDVDISLLAVIRECVIRKCNVNDLPLTFTAGIKRDRNNYIQEYVELFTQLRKPKDYLNILSKEKESTRFEDFNFYDLIFNTRQGGLTTGNFEFYKVMNHNVYSYDIKSSYPYQMIYKRLPIYSKGNTFYYNDENAQDVIDQIKSKTIEELRQGTIKGFVGVFTLENVKTKFDSNILCISKAKLLSHSNNIKCVNGKVYSADSITLRLNEADFQGIKELYNFSNIIAHEIYCTTNLHRINEAERFFLMKNFLIKENMKKDTIEYALSKVRINGMYGIKSQVEIKGYVDIKDGDVIFIPFDKKINYERREEVYKNFLEDSNINSNYDIFTDGMYIPAYAKLYLIQTMVKLERKVTKEVRKIDKDYICTILYCDTDSIKFTVKKKMPCKSSTIYNDIKPEHITLINDIISKFFKKYNNKIIKENKNFMMNNCREFIFKYKVNDNDINTLSKLGIFECENRIVKESIIPIDSFITLGAKKYGYIDGNKLATKIAGCSKEVSKAITEYSKLEKITLEEALSSIFICGMKFDETCSGRTTAYKEKHSRDELMELGIIGAGGMHISKTTYTLNITDDDKATIKFIFDDFEDDNLLCSYNYPISNIDEHGIVSNLSYK